MSGRGVTRKAIGKNTRALASAISYNAVCAGYLKIFSNEKDFMMFFHKTKGIFTLMLAQLGLELNPDAKGVNNIYKDTAEAKELERALKGVWEDRVVLDKLARLLKGHTKGPLHTLLKSPNEIMRGGVQINVIVKLILIMAVMIFSLLSAQDVFITGEERERPSIGQLIVGAFSGLVLAIPGVGDILRTAGAAGSWLSSFSKSSSGIPTALANSLKEAPVAVSSRAQKSIRSLQNVKFGLLEEKSKAAAYVDKFNNSFKVNAFTADGTVESVSPLRRYVGWTRNTLDELEKKDREVVAMKKELDQLLHKQGSIVGKFLGISHEARLKNVSNTLANTLKGRNILEAKLTTHREKPFFSPPLHLIEPAEIGKYLTDEVLNSVRHFYTHVMALEESVDSMRAKEVIILRDEMKVILVKAAGMPSTKFGEKYKKSILQFLEHNMNMVIVSQLLANVGSKMALLQSSILNEELISDIISVNKLIDMVVQRANRREIPLGRKMSIVNDIMTSLQMYNLHPANFDRTADIIVDLLIAPKIEYLTREEVYKLVSLTRRGVTDKLRLAVWEFLTCFILGGISISSVLFFINLAEGKIITAHLGRVPAAISSPMSTANSGITRQQYDTLMKALADQQKVSMQMAAQQSQILPAAPIANRPASVITNRPLSVPDAALMNERLNANAASVPRLENARGGTRKSRAYK